MFTMWRRLELHKHSSTFVSMFLFTLCPWCLDPSRAPPACLTFLATVTMQVATYLIKGITLYEAINSFRHVRGITTLSQNVTTITTLIRCAYGVKSYWVLQFLQVTTSTTQEDSQVNLSLNFTPCKQMM